MGVWKPYYCGERVSDRINIGVANVNPSAAQDTTKLVRLGNTVGKGGVWGKLESPALSKEVATAEHQPGTAL